VRQRDIERLSKDMATINRMFRDVQEAVYVQGEIVDRIDYNIANADRNVVSANKELDEVGQHLIFRY
jgi:t-SNARE complex subunit (syntaxin)